MIDTSRLIHRPIEVQLHNGLPATFVDKDAIFIIESIRDWWQEGGDWWNGEKSRTVYQIVTSEGFMYDIEVNNDTWTLYRAWD